MKCDRCNRDATHVCRKGTNVWLRACWGQSHETFCKGRVVEIEDKKEKVVTK